MYCPNCGSQNDDGVNNCANCGAQLNADNNQQAQETTTQTVNAQVTGGAAKSKMVAGILAILLGTFGVHNFYLGNQKKAIIQLCLGIGGFLTCGITSLASAVWGIIEGIQILTGKITTDANGTPLVD